MEIAGYTVIEPLGQDSASTVYLAERDHLEARYAVRILSEVAAANRESAQAFLVGAKQASEMSHPHLVKIHEFGEHEGRPFCVMDFICGSTLASKYRNLCLLDKIYVVKEVALALEFLAKFGLAHGHVNLANIFIRELDSRVVLGGHGFDPTVIPVQSASFMSLEQLGGGEVTPRSDIYSLGVVFYVLLEDELPYQANTFEELWDQVNAGEVPVVEAGKHVFRHILGKMLTNNPGKRYASISDFIAEINRISDEEILLADHIAVEPQRTQEPPATDESGSGSGFPQTNPAHRPGSGKVISMAQRLNAMAHEQQQGESEVSKLLSEHPEILEGDARYHNDGRSDDPTGNDERQISHEADREKDWDKAPLAQAANHPHIPEPGSGDQLKTDSAGPPTHASETAGDSNLQTSGPDRKTAQKPGSVHKVQISGADARPKRKRRPLNRAGLPQRASSTASTRNVSGNQASKQKSSTVAAASKPTSRQASGTASVTRDELNRTEALNYQPYRAALAKDRLGNRRGKPKAHPWRILVLTTALLTVVTIYMLPPNAQLQFYHEVIVPTRHYLLMALEHVITWVSELAS